MFQAPTHLGNARRLLDRVSSTIYRSPYCHKVLNADGRVDTVYAFFTFFPPTGFTTLSICASLFFSFLSFLPFFSTYYNSQLLAHFFHRPQLCSSVGFINRDYLLVCFSFHSSQSSRNLRLLTTHIPPYSPKVVVLMFIFSTLEWCPLHVITSKISVFLSTDSQSTGSLSFKFHVPVFSLFSPLITVAVMERKNSKSRLHNRCILLKTSPSIYKLKLLLSSD